MFKPAKNDTLFYIIKLQINNSFYLYTPSPEQSQLFSFVSKYSEQLII